MKPKIAARRPLVLELGPGNYWWCACGLSEDQPNCDGSHKGTGMTPLKVEVEEKRKVAFCMCKHSGNGAFCDGSHSGLE